MSEPAAPHESAPEETSDGSAPDGSADEETSDRSAAEESAAPAARDRGLLGIVLGLLALGGAGLLWSSSLIWSVQTVERDEPLPPLAYAISGATAVPMVVAAGFIMLAAVVAVLATRTIGRRAIALVVLLTAVVAAVTIVQWTAQSAADLAEALQTDGVRYALDQAPQESSIAIPLAFASLLLGAAATVPLLRGKNLALMGSKYERGSAKKPAARKDDAQDPQARDRDLWSSLDRGEDPTS